jgi:hypothetical protein
VSAGRRGAARGGRAVEYVTIIAKLNRVRALLRLELQCREPPGHKRRPGLDTYDNAATLRPLFRAARVPRDESTFLRCPGSRRRQNRYKYAGPGPVSRGGARRGEENENEISVYRAVDKVTSCGAHARV